MSFYIFKSKDGSNQLYTSIMIFETTTDAHTYFITVCIIFDSILLWPFYPKRYIFIVVFNDLIIYFTISDGGSSTILRGTGTKRNWG